MNAAILAKPPVFALALARFVAGSMAGAIIQAEHFGAVVSAPPVLFKAFAICQRKVLNASTYWLLARYIATIVQATNQAAIFAVIAGVCAKCIDTLAPSWLLLIVTLPILAAM